MEKFTLEVDKEYFFKYLNYWIKNGEVFGTSEAKVRDNLWGETVKLASTVANYIEDVKWSKSREVIYSWYVEFIMDRYGVPEAEVIPELYRKFYTVENGRITSK